MSRPCFWSISSHTFFPEMPCSRNSELQERNVVENHDAWNMNKSYSGEIHLTTALEGCFAGNRDEQSQSDMMEWSRVPEVCLLQCLRGKSRWTLWGYSLITRRPKLENQASEDVCSYKIVSFIVVQFHLLLVWSCIFCSLQTTWLHFRVTRNLYSPDNICC
jgi:hypothetical protein